MTILIAFIALGIGLAEGIPLGKQRQWKELVVISTLLSMALLIDLGKTVGLPTPIALLERFLEPVGGAIFK